MAGNHRASVVSSDQQHQYQQSISSSPTNAPRTTAFREHLRNTEQIDRLTRLFGEPAGFQGWVAEHHTLPTNGSSSQVRGTHNIGGTGRDDSTRSVMASHGSSMTLSHVNHGPESVMSGDHYVPSLLSAQAPTLTDSSVNTDLVSFLGGMPLLEDAGDGLLEVPRPVAPLDPLFDCAFWFLRCSYNSRDVAEWKTHCLSHFQGEDPPKTVTCPLCPFKETSGDGNQAWEARMKHMEVHHRYGQSLKTARPDFELFKHLFRKRLVDNAEYKELLGGAHSLSRAPQQFSVTSERRHDRMRGLGRDRRNRP